MLNNATATKLHEMRLSIMASAFQKQLEAQNTYGALSFEERVGLIVDEEWNARKSNRLTRLIRSADYPLPNACLEDIEYHPDRQLDRAMISRMGTCAYIEGCHNIIILGATGSGKTYLASALGMTANRNYITVKYARLPDLLGELAIARAEGNYRKVMKSYTNVKLLILDEWLLYPLKDSEARDLLEIAEGRYKKASTIFCSQFDVRGWHQKIGDPTLADAICDRIAHDSYTIIIAGTESMRKRKGLNEGGKPEGGKPEA